MSSNKLLTGYDPNSYLKIQDPNFIAILKDALSGDPDALKRKEIQSLNIGNIKAAIDWLANRDDGVSQDIKAALMGEGWRLQYYRKPPTPAEFLTYEWIGPQAETLWPNIIKAFCEFMDPAPTNPKRGLALSTSIGWGKDQPISSNIAIAAIQDPETFSYHYTYKQLKDIDIGDKILTFDGITTTVLGIQKNGVRPVYNITLSDGRSFRTSATHINTVCFRYSWTRPDKKVYDAVTTTFIKDHLHKYLFEIPTYETFKLSHMDCIQHLEALPVHDGEPIELTKVRPLRRDTAKVYIESIEPCGEEECWCLQLNNPLGLYVVEKGIFTHNSLLTNLCMAYIIVLFGMMRQPYRALGHSQPIYEHIQLPNGTYTTLADLKEGMKVAGVTTPESTVQEIIPQGLKNTYELTFNDNTTCRCSLDHYWTVFDYNLQQYVVIQTKDIIIDMDRYGFPDVEDCHKDAELIIRAEQQFSLSKKQ